MDAHKNTMTTQTLLASQSVHVCGGVYGGGPVLCHSSVSDPQPAHCTEIHNSAVSSPKQSPYHGPEMTRLCGRPQPRLPDAWCTELEVE